MVLSFIPRQTDLSVESAARATLKLMAKEIIQVSVLLLYMLHAATGNLDVKNVLRAFLEYAVGFGHKNREGRSTVGHQVSGRLPLI